LAMTFYRKESTVGRDLGHGHLRVLDATSDCGIRAAHYLSQAQADFIWANDACRFLAPTIFQNLSLFAATAVAPMTDCPPAMRSSQEEDTCAAGHPSLGSLFSLEFLISAFADKYWEWVTNESLDGPALSEDVNRVLLYCYMEKDYYDLIHINSFGSSSIFCGSALASVVHVGLVYVTSTYGFSAGEHCPYKMCSVLASYGAFVKPMPFTNELGIQMSDWCVFSHYSFHGNVTRYVQNVSRHYNFVAHCCICGEMQVVKWNSLGHSTCSCSSFTQGPSTVTLSGPLWMPSTQWQISRKMIEMATSAQVSADQKLRELLDIMIEENDPNLLLQYGSLDQLIIQRVGASFFGVFSEYLLSKRNSVLVTLHLWGCSTCQSHIASNAIKTSAPMCLRVEITWSLMQ
ncbi:hypothetical protein BDL97_16G086900, partial [Sphagnum fallax]